MSGCGEEIDDFFDGFVGAVVGGFELAVGTVLGVRAVVEAAVGERSAQPFMEEQKEQGNLDALDGEAIGVAGSVTLDEAVRFELAQVVAELVEAISTFGETEGGENGVVDLLGRPAADVRAAMEENLEEADDAWVMDFDSRMADRTDGDRQGHALEKREVDMDVEPLRLETGEAAGDGLERLADRIEMVQSFPETEVGEVVGAQFVAQEGRELLILLEESAFEIGAEDMMAMLDPIDDGGELAAVPAVQAGAEDRGDLVGGQPPQAEFAASLEQLVNGKVALENEVAKDSDIGKRRCQAAARRSTIFSMALSARW